MTHENNILSPLCGRDPKPLLYLFCIKKTAGTVRSSHRGLL